MKFMFVVFCEAQQVADVLAVLRAAHADKICCFRHVLTDKNINFVSEHFVHLRGRTSLPNVVAGKTVCYVFSFEVEKLVQAMPIMGDGELSNGDVFAKIAVWPTTEQTVVALGQSFAKTGQHIAEHDKPVTTHPGFIIGDGHKPVSVDCGRQYD